MASNWYMLPADNTYLVGWTKMDASAAGKSQFRILILVMMAKWVKAYAPVVWCDQWPEHVLELWVRIRLGAWLVCVPLYSH